MHNFAPVLIPTLNRYKHFKRCVESLAECTHAEKTDLYIALDYPLNESHWDGYKKIANYVNEIKGFKAVVIIKRDKNYGAIKNVKEARKEIFKKYDRIIVLEDDNEFSPNFLDYINKGLEVYKNRDDILSICGYNFPIQIPNGYNKDIYLWTGVSGWGYGTWKNKWEQIDWSISEIKTFIRKRKNVRRLNNIADHLYYSLKRIIETGNITGDTFLSYYNLANKMYTVYPCISRVRNTGHDGTGVHCGIDNRFVNQKIYEGLDEVILPANLGIDSDIYQIIREYFKISYTAKIKRILKTIIRNLRTHGK